MKASTKALQELKAGLTPGWRDDNGYRIHAGVGGDALICETKHTDANEHDHDLLVLAPELLDEVLEVRARRVLDVIYTKENCCYGDCVVGNQHDADCASPDGKRQAALEILGKAIAVLLPEFRASGDVVEHATKMADELVARFEKMNQALLMDSFERYYESKWRDEIEAGKAVRAERDKLRILFGKADDIIAAHVPGPEWKKWREAVSK